ncbi:hypothetical protein Dsin_015578, partial [Dipteronia sinensis]
ESSSSKATFSLNPTSQDCMVIALSAQPGKINIKTCYVGDKSWKIFEFRGEEYEENCISDVAYVAIVCFNYDGGSGGLIHRKRNGLIGMK